MTIMQRKAVNEKNEVFAYYSFYFVKITFKNYFDFVLIKQYYNNMIKGHDMDY